MICKMYLADGIQIKERFKYVNIYYLYEFHGLLSLTENIRMRLIG